jgi:hypothetical protein
MRDLVCLFLLVFLRFECFMSILGFAYLWFLGASGQLYIYFSFHVHSEQCADCCEGSRGVVCARTTPVLCG